MVLGRGQCWAPRQRHDPRQLADASRRTARRVTHSTNASPQARSNATIGRCRLCDHECAAADERGGTTTRARQLDHGSFLSNHVNSRAYRTGTKFVWPATMELLHLRGRCRAGRADASKRRCRNATTERAGSTLAGVQPPRGAAKSKARRGWRRVPLALFAAACLLCSGAAQAQDQTQLAR